MIYHSNIFGQNFSENIWIFFLSLPHMVIYICFTVFWYFLQVSVESLGEETSSQGMIVHTTKLLIEEMWVT